jgi:hypothetical protein
MSLQVAGEIQKQEAAGETVSASSEGFASEQRREKKVQPEEVSIADFCSSVSGRSVWLGPML